MANSEVQAAIARAAVKYGVDPRTLMTFARIESSGDPRARTGKYRGLFQLSADEFAKNGGTGDIYDPVANADAAAAKLKKQTGQFRDRYGRDPSASDLYMIHQQGEGGYAKHSANPGAPAWENMYATAEGRAKGPGWAKQAIWGNVPSDLKDKFGSVDNITSQQFMDLWSGKVNGKSNADLGAVAKSSGPNPSSESQNGGDMLNFLAALGGSGNIMSALGKGLGMESLTNAGGSNNVFGSLAGMFGGGQGQGGDQDQGNAMGDANMKLANQAMSSAGGGDEKMPVYQRKPIDLANLSKILQQRAQLGAAGVQRQPGAGGVGLGSY